jgi:hypothetical protein
MKFSYNRDEFIFILLNQIKQKQDKKGLVKYPKTSTFILLRIIHKKEINNLQKINTI